MDESQRVMLFFKNPILLDRIWWRILEQMCDADSVNHI